MSNLFARTSVVLLVLFFPAAMFADLSQAPILPSGNTLNLDTGAIASTGGDILFTGTSITLQGSAKAYIFGTGGPGQFALLIEATLAAVAPIYDQTPISGPSLAVNTVFAVYTNAGHYAKILITALSSSSITIQFTTYGASGGVSPGSPTISKIQNNYSNVAAGLPNYGIAPSTLFVIYGTGLANPTAKAVLQSSASPGIPLTLNGASISVTVNGVTTHPGIYYAISTQIAAVLPASTPIGTGTLTVTYNGLTSAAATIQVVQSALGLDTLSGMPSGLVVATDPLSPTGALFNYNASASPGQLVTLWGSGLGADPADSDTVFASSPSAVNVALAIYIGGVQAKIQYAGSSGYPGLVQINVYIPQDVQPGCGVPIVGVVGTFVSNTVTIPVAAGGGVCTDPIHGTDGNGLLTSESQKSHNSATLAIAQTTTVKQTQAFASATFVKVQNLPYAPGYGYVTLGGCLVLQSAAGLTGTNTYLNAGNVTITGPTGTQQLVQSTQGQLITYEVNLPSGFFPSSGGTFTFQGSGGPDVGPFSVSVTDDSPLVWTNQSAITTVNRAQGVTVTWTGGVPGTYVAIGGGSTTIAVSGTFLCYAPVSAGQFTVPPYVLEASPVGNGGINLLNQSSGGTFHANGLDLTFAVAETESSIGVPFN